MKNHQQHTYHLVFQKITVGEDKAAKELIWAPDWQNIQRENQTKLYAQKLASKGEMDLAEAYFIISGLVIASANQGMNQPGPDVFFYSCKSAAVYTGGQELFMSTKCGDTILALDAPFKLSFEEGSCNSQLDAPGGIMVVYGFKYEIAAEKGIEIQKAGITMLQHLTANTHQNQLHIFSAQVAPHIAKFSANIAVQQARFGEPSSSNNSSSAEMVSPGFYWC